jgi:Fe-S cluster assembly protein SufB
MTQCTRRCPATLFHGGINTMLVRLLSQRKQEPSWMLDFRLAALAQFESMALPKQHKEIFAALDLSKLCYYVNPCSSCTSTCSVVGAKNFRDSDSGVLNSQSREFQRGDSGVEGFRAASSDVGNACAGTSLQQESEVVATTLRKKWADRGVIFCSMDEAVQKYPELVRKYIGTVVMHDNNIFAALNGAVWSGGSFVYVPAGVQIDEPLSTFFSIQTHHFGQFERTLIVADKGARVHYFEGCESSKNAECVLHSGVVELVALEDASIRYSTVQQWSPQVFNLVTKRAVAHKNSTIEWIDGNVGSKLTMKYPTTILQGDGARAQLISLSIAGAGQVQDSGGSMIHKASNTQSYILSKSLCSRGGRSIFNGLVHVDAEAQNVLAESRCESLLLDAQSSTASYPRVDCYNNSARVTHEATVSALDARQLFYLQSRGIGEQEAHALMINGFVEAFVTQLPFEYGVEIQRLLDETLSGSSL